MNRPTGTIDLAVLVNGFPRLSETFVLHELLELERRGLRLHVFALRRPEEVVQQDALSELRATVEYLPEGAAVPYRRSRVRLAHSALLLHRKLGYLHGYADVLASPEFSRSLGMNAALLAHRLVRLGSPPLYIHFAHKPATIGRFASLLAGVPYALSAHAKDIWLTPEAELARKVRDASVVLTCTEQGRAQLALLADDQTPVHLVYHGVEVKGRTRSPRGDDTARILAVGRLVEKKGHAALLLAASLLRERGLEFSLRLAGEGPEWSRLQRLVHELGLGDCVVFLGPLSESEVRAEYEQADIFALPCRKLANGDQDGLPNVILEAMAHGLPVVSTRLAGITEAIDEGESGLLADQDDPRALAEQLSYLIEDVQLRERIGEAGRARVAACFERGANLPRVVEALVEAGILAPAQASGDQRALRAVA